MRVVCPECQFGWDANGDDEPTLVCPKCNFEFPISDVPTQQQNFEAIPIAGYRLQRVIATGGFGALYLAERQSDGKNVAIKILNEERRHDADSVRRFRREYQNAVKLKHPHLLSVFEFGECDGIAYLVGEYIDGRTIAGSHPRPANDFPGLARQLAGVARGLQHCHEHQIYHRDVKPSNILVGPEDRAVLLDFGLSRAEADSELTIQGALLGTPAYMSPEQARGSLDEVKVHSDIFSLGAVLYRLVAGRAPYVGNRDSVVLQARQGAYPPLTAQTNAIPRSIIDICHRAMAVEPIDRYATAQQMAEDLEAFAEGRPLLHARRRWFATRRSRRLATSCVLATILLVALTLVIWQAPGPKQSRVVISTVPAGARLAFFPIDSATGRPARDKRVRLNAPAQPVDLAIGDYLIVADIPGFGFHEVFRRVPDRHVEVPGVLPHVSWKLSADKTVVLAPISIPANKSPPNQTKLSGGPFRLGDAKLGAIAPEYLCSLEPFWLDQKEVTIGDYFREIKALPAAFPVSFKSPEDRQRYVDEHASEAITWVTYDEATRYAESVGKRLPTEAEFEFACTNGGATPYPWSDPLRGLTEWSYAGEADCERDMTPTEPPIRALMSNVVEWTSSFGTYQGVANPLRNRPEAFRVIRGGSHFVTQRKKSPLTPLEFSTRWRSQEACESAHPGLGFRCAKSASADPYFK